MGRGYLKAQGVCLSENFSSVLKTFRILLNYCLLPKISSKIHQKSVHAGISGIERSLQLKKQNRDATISVAFEDLNNLMTKVHYSFLISAFNIVLVI